MQYEIVSLNDQAMGVCYVNNKITFVSNTVVEDIIKLEIIEEHKKYNIAKVLEYVSKSKSRCDAFCPYFGECGGCHLQNMSYEDTLEYKKKKVKNILHKFAGIDIDVDIIATKDKNYRNKITLKVINKKIGYYSYNSNDIVEINKCMIASDAINNFISILPKFNIKNGEIVIRSNYNSELLIHITSDDKINIPDISNYKVVGIILNDKLIYGEDHFMELINNKFFQVSYNSFFQINREITSYLFNFIRDNIIKNKNVLDLYCGVGTLGINVGDISNSVYGIEIIENAVLNAVLNSKINKLNNTKYLLNDASKVIDKINDKIDIILIDPPRAGISKKEIDTILKIKPIQIFYVSCDPITLARDLKYLKGEYEIKQIKVLDMFAYTYHCENITVLERR